MLLAQVWTIRDGKETRMEMYADPAEALTAVGLETWAMTRVRSPASG